jgi:hypothetical protein
MFHPSNLSHWGKRIVKDVCADLLLLRLCLLLGPFQEPKDKEAEAAEEAD